MTGTVAPSAAQAPAIPDAQVVGQVADRAVDPVITPAIRLTDARLKESSGLAYSHRSENCFWSHNDSGGAAELFAFNAKGDSLRRARLPKVDHADDWEDMASYRDGGVPRLLIADCGDNLAKRSSVLLYLFDEPDPVGSDSVSKVQTIRVTYPDAPRDCEAVAVDTRRRLIILITKSVLPISNVYAVPLPVKLESKTINVTAKRITSLPMPMVTGADFDPQTGDLWLINYFQAYRFAAIDSSQPLSKQLSVLPTAIDLPHLKQIEAVAVDDDSGVWVTTEGSPAMMQKLPKLNLK